MRISFIRSPHVQSFCRTLFPLALLLVLLLSVADIGQPLPGRYGDKFEHALAFFMLSALAGMAHAGARYLPRLMLGLLGYGLLIEVIQWWLPWREFSLLDWAADGVGVALWMALAARYAGRIA